MAGPDITKRSENEAYFVVCIQELGNELIAAECAALTGCAPDPDGFALCGRISEVPRSAYIRLGAVVLANAPTFAVLLQKIAALALNADEFRVEFYDLPGAPKIVALDAIVSIADIMEGNPRLEHPKRRFALVVREESFWFGEICAVPDRDWRKHDDKPWRTSASLPSRLSRALVNLVATPSDIIINPCCGTGSLLLEAAEIGAVAYGADWNKRMVGMSNKNMEHFGYPVPITHTNVTLWDKHGDVVLVDLPYDRNCKTSEANIRAIMSHARTLAPIAVFVAEEDLTAWLTDAGYTRFTIHRVEKSVKFSRYIHVAEA